MVITGLGAVAPNGIGKESFWNATRAGTSGVNRIEGFDTAELPVRIAGQVLDFDPAQHAPRKELRHLPRAVLLALASSAEALQDAGIDSAGLSLDERRGFGVIVGSGGAGMEFTERQFREYYFGNPKAVSLYTVPSSTPGSISSELSMRFALRGPSHVMTTGCTSSTVWCSNPCASWPAWWINWPRASRPRRCRNSNPMSLPTWGSGSDA